MSILFRCPCGRSMVAEEDRAGAVVMCPNCRRSLKVPSGKERGMHIASAPSTVRTSRLCQRCGKEVPVDSQMCPHCKAVLLDAKGAPAPAKAAAAAPAGARTASGVAAGAAAKEAGQPIMYGGARGSWFSRLSPGGKAGVIGGAAAFVIVLSLIGYFVYSSWHAGQLTEAHDLAVKVITDGRKLEILGKYQDAYDLYWTAIGKKVYLLETGEPKDAQAIETIESRANALQYLAYDVKVRGDVQWKPKNQEEYDQAVADRVKSYPSYKEWLFTLADAGLAAAAYAKANPGDQTGFELRVGQAMDAYVSFIGKTTKPQRAQRTFQSLLEGLKQLGGADRNWAKPAERDVYLKNAEGYLNALKETATRGEDDFWIR